MSYLETEAKAVAALKKAIPSSLKQNMLSLSKGLSAEVYENNEVFPNHYLGCAIDSAGTKVMIAELMEKYDTIGIDCVAMSANDLAVFGNMSPFLFMDCLSTQNQIQEKEITADIIRGIACGLKECDASGILRNSIKLNLGKGETASVHEILDGPKPGFSFDIVGCMIGFIPKKKFHLDMKNKDTIIALPSSGPHCNGFTDLRHYLLNGNFETRQQYKKNYKGRFDINDKPEGKRVGDMLLEPTRLYVKDMAMISKDFDVIGVNVTGYGLKNLNRVPGDFQFTIDEPLKPQPIFELMQKESKFSEEKMYTTFNMGMGFFVLTNKKDSDSIMQKIRGSKVVGSMKKGKKATILNKNSKKITFEGY